MRKLKRNYFMIIASIISILGVILQLIPYIPKLFKIISLGVIIILLFLSLFFTVYDRHIVKRKKVIKLGLNIIHNAMDKVVLFGGDLSWTDDYLDDLHAIILNNKTVEVLFPESKYNAAANGARILFDNRIANLKAIGATVYKFSQDVGLRCIMADPDTFSSPQDFKVFSSKSVKKHSINSNKNKYLVECYNFNEEEHKSTCNSYLGHYKLISIIRTSV